MFLGHALHRHQVTVPEVDFPGAPSKRSGATEGDGAAQQWAMAGRVLTTGSPGSGLKLQALLSVEGQATYPLGAIKKFVNLAEVLVVGWVALGCHSETGR